MLNNNKKKMSLIRQKAILATLVGFMAIPNISGCSFESGKGSTGSTIIEEGATEESTTEEATTEVTTEVVNNDIIETIIEKYNSISDEKITRENVGKIEVGQANLFIENGEYVFDPSASYDQSKEQIDRDRTKGIVTFINRTNKKAIASMGYVDGNLSTIYVRKYYSRADGYIESDPEMYVLDIDEENYKPEVDYYNNVVTYIKK